MNPHGPSGEAQSAIGCQKIKVLVLFPRCALFPGQDPVPAQKREPQKSMGGQRIVDKNIQ
jgi:hypothetical protein